MVADADLEQFGLKRCQRCRRIMTSENLDKGRCKPGNECGAAEMIRLAAEDGHPDSRLFVSAVEKGLMQ